MSARIFELQTFPQLPLWAQVLLASRITRRAVVWLPSRGVTPGTADVLLAGCDAIDRCATEGRMLPELSEPIRRARDFQPTNASYAASLAMASTVDAATAAEAAMDFSAAESACSTSVGKAIEHARSATGLNPLQAAIFLASDLDQLRFACTEARIGRYDALSADVIQRLAPVHAPDPRDLDRAPKPRAEHDDR